MIDTKISAAEIILCRNLLQEDVGEEMSNNGKWKAVKCSKENVAYNFSGDN